MPSREGGEEQEIGCMHAAVRHPQNYRRLATCQQRAKQLNTFDPQYMQNSPPREPNSTRKTDTSCKMPTNLLDFAEERCSRGMKDLARGRMTRHQTTHARAYELRVMLAQTASCYRQNLGPNGPPSYLSVMLHGGSGEDGGSISSFLVRHREHHRRPFFFKIRGRGWGLAMSRRK